MRPRVRPRSAWLQTWASGSMTLAGWLLLRAPGVPAQRGVPCSEHTLLPGLDLPPHTPLSLIYPRPPHLPVKQLIGPDRHLTQAGPIRSFSWQWGWGPVCKAGQGQRTGLACMAVWAVHCTTPGGAIRINEPMNGTTGPARRGTSRNGGA